MFLSIVIKSMKSYQIPSVQNVRYEHVAMAEFFIKKFF